MWPSKIRLLGVAEARHGPGGGPGAQGGAHPGQAAPPSQGHHPTQGEAEKKSYNVRLVVVMAISLQTEQTKNRNDYQ